LLQRCTFRSQAPARRSPASDSRTRFTLNSSALCLLPRRTEVKFLERNITSRSALPRESWDQRGSHNLQQSLDRSSELKSPHQHNRTSAILPGLYSCSMDQETTGLHRSIIISRLLDSRFCGKIVVLSQDFFTSHPDHRQTGILNVQSVRSKSLQNFPVEVAAYRLLGVFLY
jgi:hypothetical protein